MRNTGSGFVSAAFLATLAIFAMLRAAIASAFAFALSLLAANIWLAVFALPLLVGLLAGLLACVVLVITYVSLVSCKAQNCTLSLLCSTTTGAAKP